VGEDRSLWKDHVAVFSPDTPMDSKTGIEVLTGPRDLAKVKRDLAAAGYKGEKVVMLGAVDYAQINACALVAEDLLKRCGMNVDFQAIDWGTTIQRRNSRQPPDKGGWNIFFTNLTGTNNFDPAGHLGIRGNGDNAWFGWPNMPRMEALRNEWFEAPDLAEQKRICAEIEKQFWIDAPHIPLGCVYGPTAYSNTLTGVRTGFIQFYDVRRA
jgi:peptide/nickel transport system substrate-binding protein